MQIQLQPSISGHPTFMDIFVVVMSEKWPGCFIEIKNASLFSTLEVISDIVAQSMRKDHILLCESGYEIEEIPFVLTNSYVWSFGLVKRKMLKIELEKWDKKERKQWKELNSALQSVIQGKFSSGKRID